MQIEDQYLGLLRELLDQPETSDRTGTGTRKVFGRQLRHKLSQGFPLLTTKCVWLKGVAEELRWFLSGSTSIKPLVDQGVSIWTPNAYAEYCDNTENPVSLEEFEDRIRSGRAPESWSDLGPVYGSQWRGFGGVDQIQELVEGLKHNPDSRRHVVSAWNPPELSQMALPPCFVPGTLVACRDKYKRIENVTKSDTVLTDQGTYASVDKVFETRYSGPIKSLDISHCLNIECTPGHPIRTQGEWKKAEEISSGDYVGVPRQSRGTYKHKWSKFDYYNRFTDEHVYSTSSENIDEETAWALGFFAGDGWINHNLDKDKSKINRFHLSIGDEDSVVDRFQEALDVNLTPTEKSGTSTKYESTSAKYANLLRSMGRGAHNKRIPSQIFSAPHSVIRSFLSGYKAADGCESDGRTIYSTVSKELALGIQRLYAVIGKPCSISKQNRKPKTVIDGRVVNQRDSYLVTVLNNPKNESPRYKIDEDFIWYRVESISNREFNGYVYNLSVESEHTYTAKNIANHNCHFAFQCFSRETETGERELSLMWSQRSADAFLGLPFNLASYALLTHVLARATGHVPGTVIGSLGDVHLYTNHVQQAREQLSREPLELPVLKLEQESVTEFSAEAKAYNHHPSIQAPIAT